MIQPKTSPSTIFQNENVQVVSSIHSFSLELYSMQEWVFDLNPFFLDTLFWLWLGKST